MPVDKIAVPGPQVAARFHDHAKVEAKPMIVAVGTVPVNLVVITRIAERASLKAAALTPKDALQRLSSLNPAVLVIDGGVDNCECDMLLDAVQQIRESSGNGHPRVLFLATAADAETQSLLQPLMDAVVPKPIVADRLEAALARLVQLGR
jgi:CheY-like chemotaxis protein